MFHSFARYVELFDHIGPWSSRRDPWRHTPGITDRVVLTRRANAADEPALADLAALDSAAVLEGEVLVALVDGELWAAIGLDDGRVIADPFRPSREVVDLLLLRYERLRRREREPEQAPAGHALRAHEA